MAVSLFSPSWYRVAGLKPRLRNHVEIHRHDYRDQIWFVLQDHAGGRSHRIPPAAYRLIGFMDGERSVDRLWELANNQFAEDAPTQDEVIRLLAQLHSADALICDVPPDGLELFRRFQRHERSRWRQRLWSPLAVRVPLLDPDKLLTRTLPLARPLFGWGGAILWLALVIAGAIMAGVHWQGLTENIVDRALTPQNLALLWLVYPAVKTFHELGHGYAVKIAGGEVHEIGIMFLVLIPVPYVDASASSGFRDKYHRMVVGAIGIMLEMAIAAVALFIWIYAEPGAVHAIAYNVILIGGISTLLFNGNPLLRFDGYYVLADALEIPNLGSRSNKYLGYLVQRYLFASKDAETPVTVSSERLWFLLYGVAAFIYRLFIMFAIILYIGGKFFTIGILLAIWATITQIGVPIGKSMKFLFSDRKLRKNRGRALVVSTALLAAVLALLFVVPAPLWTRAEGVAWPPQNSQVRAAADGFIQEILVTAGAKVRSGQPLLQARDLFLNARVDVLKSQLSGLGMQYAALRNTDRVQAAIVREEITTVKSDLNRSKEVTAALILRSPRDGYLVLPNEKDLKGRFVRKGQLLGYVMQKGDRLKARVVVPQDNISLVRDRTKGVEVASATWGGRGYPTKIERQVPGGSQQLPSPALGTVGGGQIAVDPRDGKGLTTLQRVFEFEISLPPEAGIRHFGQRVHVRFDHGYEPIGFQAYRALRQLFLKVFSV